MIECGPRTTLDPKGDLIPKDLGIWFRKEDFVSIECVSPHRKLDPTKGDPIAKALTHLKKVRKVFVTIENET